MKIYGVPIYLDDSFIAFYPGVVLGSYILDINKIFEYSNFILFKEFILKLDDKFIENLIFHELGHHNTKDLIKYDYEKDYKMIETLADIYACEQLGYNEYIKIKRLFELSYKLNILSNIKFIDNDKELINRRDQLLAQGVDISPRIRLDIRNRKLIKLR
jgi:hypothetical protein